tara:strand:- start:1608 stop:2573 length:966 start_codon:yes stop_codon:yes gene_type:complete
MKSMQYFNRSGAAEPDGRTFDERTLQAVNLTAANVGSYREFAAALALARSGSVITVTEKILIPETILIRKSNLKIICEGRGGFEPSDKDLTLFSLENVENVFFDSVKVIESPVHGYFSRFVYHRFTSAATADPTDVKNISIRKCIVEAKVFLEVDINGNVPASVSPLPADLNAWYRYGNNRSFVVDNIHTYSVTSGVGPDPTHFILADFLAFWTIRGNESTGMILTHNGTLNQIQGNTLMGFEVKSGNVFPLTALVDKPFSVYFQASNLTNPGGSNVIMGNYCYGYVGKLYGPFFDPTAAPGVTNNSNRDLFFGNFVLEDV